MGAELNDSLAKPLHHEDLDRCLRRHGDNGRSGAVEQRAGTLPS
jgi:hypothetical protein